MRALVTGANGFLGRHVVDALLARGVERPRHGPPGRAYWNRLAGLPRWRFSGPICAPRANSRAHFEGVDALVHLAAVVSGGEDAQFAGTVAGTERLLDAMASSACRRMVLCSSFSVYDYSSTRRILDENSPLHKAPDVYARDGYTIAKWWQERVTRRYAEKHGWDLRVLRPGFIWGRDHGYLAALGQQFGRHHLVIGPRTRIPMTHVENCADVFAAAVTDPRASGQTLNVVDGSRRAHLELPFRLYARQRPEGLALARSLLARHVGGAFGLCRQSSGEPPKSPPSSSRVGSSAAQAASLRKPKVAGDTGMDPSARLPAMSGWNVQPVVNARLRSEHEPSITVAF